MYLSAFPHRIELFEITNRWLSNQLEPDDALQITRIISYDSYAVWETLLDFIDDLLGSLSVLSVYRKVLSNKKELKDFICNHTFKKNERIESLISSYVETPEFYYVGAPMAGYIYHDPSSFKILCICRFKRGKRIAEKANRYASMYIINEIESIAKEISNRKNPSLSMENKVHKKTFRKAEKRLMDRIRDNGIKLPARSMIIKDILGIKIIDYGFGEDKLESVINGISAAKIIEREKHAGKYNAIHYVVELQIDFNHIIDRFKKKGRYLEFDQRGLKTDDISEDFMKFIITGKNNFQVDLIFTSLEEFIESEIGRSMHENRIFRQREQKKYGSNILDNMEYIIEYLFAVGMSPTIHIDEIPIKLWGRYLPDTISYRIRQLFQIPEYALIGV